MVDPDAPNPSNPTLREYLHWLVQLINPYIIYFFQTFLMAYRIIGNLAWHGFSNYLYIHTLHKGWLQISLEHLTLVMEQWKPSMKVRFRWLESIVLCLCSTNKSAGIP